MGEIQNRCFQLSFNAPLRVGFQGSRVTSDAGLILVRELDERLGFGELIAQHLTDSRGKNVQPGLDDLLRQKVLRNEANPGFWSRQGSGRTRPGPRPGRNANERLRVEVFGAKLVRNPKGKRKFQLTIHFANDGSVK
jgi:hypothetical protein